MNKLNKMLRSSIVMGFLATLAVPAPARAQEVTRLPEEARQSVGLDGGLEAAFVTRATYQHRVDLGVVPDARLFARFTLPVASPDLGDWALDLGLRATPVAWGNVRLALLLGPVVRNAVNSLYSATATGIGATALFGYEGARWGISAEVAYEQILATHLRHSDLYRDTVYEGAKNGWYAMTGSTLRAGLRGGARLGPVELFARGGIEKSGHLNPHGVPFYATLGTAYAF